MDSYRADKTINYHTLPIEDVKAKLRTADSGLSEAEVVLRREQFGKNQLQESKKKTLGGMFIAQFRDVMIIVLLVAAAIAGFLGELADAIIIGLVVLINATLGAAQESKAEKALEALKSMASPQARVLRNGEMQILNTADIVPGDIVQFEAGDFVP
ncbi:MAG: ATPase, partial [Clostridiales bacterium]|nr:ATPase [Clostridiales bacterium]